MDARHRDIDLATYLHRAALAYPHRIAIRDEQGEVSYRELARAIDASAVGLARRGVGAGDRVALLLPNGPRWVESYFAVVQIGATVVPVTTRIVARELDYLLADSTPRLIITEPAHAPLIETIAYRCAVAYSAEELRVANDIFRPPIPPETIASILYTSGTTGQPKGTMRSQLAASFIVPIRQAAMGIDPSTRLLATTPMFHAAGHEFMMFQTLAAGGLVISRNQFDEQEVAALLERERITHAFFVPAMAARLVPEIERQRIDTRALRLWCSAASPMDDTLRRRIRAAAPDAKLWNVYGVTEGGVATYLRDDEIDAQPGTCVGRPGPGAEVRCLAAEGDVGEIVVRSPEAMTGYWNRPAETAETLRDGWVHTGDLGRFDAAGLLHLVGRSKDMINSGGEKVYAAEVENVLAAASGVAELTIIGVPHPVWGEAVVAVAVGDETAIEPLARAALAAHKRPKRVVCVEALPRNSFGKVDKGMLRQRFARLFE